MRSVEFACRLRECDIDVVGAVDLVVAEAVHAEDMVDDEKDMRDSVAGVGVAVVGETMDSERSGVDKRNGEMREKAAEAMVVVTE